MSEEANWQSWWDVAKAILTSPMLREYEALLTETNSGYDPAEDAS